MQGEPLEAWRAALSARAAAQPWAVEQVNAFYEMARGVGWGQIEAEVGAPYDVMRSGSMRFFGAPAAVVVSEKRSPGADWSDRDGLAAFVTLFMLAACEAGLGTCWLGFANGQPDLLRQHVRLPDDEQSVAVLSLGYPDDNAPVNLFRSPRREIEAFTRWLS